MKSGENVMDMEMKMSKVIEDKSGSGSASASPLPKLISSRSPSDLNNHKPLSQEMTRTLKEEETEASRKKALTKMPSEAELEDFFSAAEKYEQNRFAEKYNYDIVKDVPLEGRYEWKKNNITYPTKVDKVETLKRYRFSLALENSNEEDYVTEKFFQSLVAGSIPVVVGAPNIQEFAPAPGSVLHIKQLSDVDKVSETMKYLSQDPRAFNETLRWKYEGPSDSFKGLVDMTAVHSSCRLCIFLATKIREKEEKTPIFNKRPCRCDEGSQTVYHLYVRERRRFEMTSIFLRSHNLTMAALESAVLLNFKYLNHVPIWKDERPESIGGGFELKLCCSLGCTQI